MCSVFYLSCYLIMFLSCHLYKMSVFEEDKALEFTHEGFYKGSCPPSILKFSKSCIKGFKKRLIKLAFVSRQAICEGE
uniref:Secreted protein n=1 Tax=Anguilla anguilla TaxID=7936 RepID=A0A0E9QU12_ANGAN